MEVIHTLLIVAASSCLLPQQAFCSTYTVCNGRVTEQSDNSTDLPECTIMGNEPKSWEDASVYCRSFGGALRSSGVDRADIFIENGVSSLWSGIFKRNGTALQETPKTPIQAVWDVDQWDLSQLSEIPGQSECAQFVHKPCDVIRLERRKRRQTQDQGKDGCKYKFVLEWTNCASKRDFVCEIPARPLLSLHMQANKKFSIDAELGFEMFFTSGKASYQSSSLLCGRGQGSFTFNISTPVDRAVIKFVAQNVKDHIQQLGLSGLDHQTSLFWVDDIDTPGCDALSLQTFGDEGFAFGHIISWSCEARLRVLCKSQVPVRGTEAPLISVNLYGQDQLAMGQDKSILVHSKIPKTAYIGILGRRKGAGLQIGCHVSTPSNGQRVTLYQDNQPILYYDGKKDMSQEIITSLEDEATHLNESPIMIDLAGFYHCEMNDLRTHRVLKSDRIFIQRRDLELYSIQIRFKHYSDQADLNRLQQELLFNDHRGQREAGRRLIYGLKATAQHAGGFSIKPLTLEPRSRTLVAYLYRALPEMKQHPITEVTLNKIRLQEIQQVSNSIIGWTEGSLVIKQVTVKSIDYCVGTSRPDSIAGLEHPLPDMKAPGTYITPWVCVSGDTSLATAECTGDKRWGYEWGDIKATCQGRIVEMTSSTTPETSLSTTGVPFTDETDEPSSDETDEPSTEITEEPVTDVPSTDVPATDVPATDVPATDLPATDLPATDVPATDVPPIYVPATDVPATDFPATDVPPTYVPPIYVPPTYVPATDFPATYVPATDVPPTYVPATDVPPIYVPATDVPPTYVPATDVPPTYVPATDFPATYVPATDFPATYVPATDVPATDFPATDVPPTYVPATDVPPTYVPATDFPATYVPATDVPATDFPATDVPPTYVPATDVPPTYVPATDFPPTYVPATDVPPTYVPATDFPATDVPATDVPATDFPATDVPPTYVPATDVPATDVPATYVPATDVPATDFPATDFPATDVPATDVPPTYVPATDVPPTYVPATDVPPTYVPATDVPPTYVPATDVPPTYVPATDVPPTYVPATDVPPTYVPATDVPPTYVPATDVPPTYVPATDVPPTYVPATDFPATYVPATDFPATYVPATDVPFTDLPSTDVPFTEITEEPVTDVIEAYSTLTKLETTTSQALETTSTKTVAPIKSTSLPFSNSTDSTIDRRQRDVLGTTEKISRLVRTVISAMRLSLSNVTLQFRKQIDDILDPQNKTENRTISESGYLNGTVDDDALELSSNESTTQIVPTALHDGSSSSEGRKPTEEVTDRPPVLKCPARNLSVELTNRTYALPESPVETVWNSTETCARGNGPLVTTKCMEDKTKVVKWAPYQVNPLCNHTSVTRVTSPKTKKLVALSVKTIDKKNVAEVSENLRTLINASEPENFTTTDVALIADTLTKVAQMESEDLPEQTAQAILDSVSDVSQLPGDVLQGAQNESDATNRILRTADKLGSLLQLDSDETSKRLVSGGIGLEVWDIDKQSPGDLSVIGIKVISEGEKDKIGEDQLQTQFTDSSRTNDNTQTAIYLPEEILQQYTSGNQTSKVRLVMNVYKDTNLYDSSASDTMISVDGAKVNRTLNSRVIAAQLLVNGTQISDLGGSKVVAVFEPIVTDVAKEGWTHKISCAFWNFSSDLSDGHWSTEGCEHNIDENGRVVCECTHLTNFAVLLDYYDQSSMAHKEVLGYITKIGLSLSIIGLTLSMIAFLCIKKLRKGRPQQTMFQLSLSLVLSWLVFLIGIERTSNYGGCLFVAALLHYLILTSFMWMLMEAVVQYLLFVKVMNPHISHYMWKMGLPSWGLPLIPVVIILATDHENYIGGDHYCWMSRHVMYYGFALPVGLILLSNLGIFILIVVSLFRRKDMSEHSSMKTNQTLVNIRASFISFCMLGLTWLFGFLAIEGARLVFQYLFCITASLQGFFIFLMITARDRQIRRYLLDNVCCCLKKWVRRDSSGVTPTSTLSVGRKRSRPLKARLTELFFGTATGKSNEAMSTTATMLPSESITKADTSSIGDEHTIPSDPTEDVESKAEATV